MADKVKIGVVGYGTIGERIADGVDMQDDMELVGVVDVAPSLPVRALVESGKGYPIFCGYEEAVPDLEAAGIPLAGLLEDLLQEVDMVADTLFNSMANYDAAYGKDYLKCLSCNTTGIARQAMAVDHAVGLEEMVCMILRRSADISETHKGPVDALLPEPIPSHQAADFAIVCPHIKCITSVVTAPVCHGHATTMIFDTKEPLTRDEVIDIFRACARLRIFRLEDGFISTSHIFDYCRDAGKSRGDMYEVPIWGESIYLDHDGHRVYSINMIPQEAIIIPENIDAIRCVLKMQDNWQDAFDRTNENLGMKRGR